MFLERRTGVKMDLSLYNIRVNVKVTEFPLSNHSSNPFPPPPPFFFKGGGWTFSKLAKMGEIRFLFNMGRDRKKGWDGVIRRG